MAHPVIVASFLGISRGLTCTSERQYLGVPGSTSGKAVRECLAWGSMFIDSGLRCEYKRAYGRRVVEGVNWHGAVICD